MLLLCSFSYFSILHFFKIFDLLKGRLLKDKRIVEVKIFRFNLRKVWRNLNWKFRQAAFVLFGSQSQGAGTGLGRVQSAEDVFAAKLKTNNV